MVLAEARIYTSTPVQSAFHYLNQALHAAGFDEPELQRSRRDDEVSLVIWRPAALTSTTAAAAFPHGTPDLDTDGLYACGIQGSFARHAGGAGSTGDGLARKKSTKSKSNSKSKNKTVFSWELRLDYDPPREHANNTHRLYHVDLQCVLREDGKRRPTETICFHYNNDARPAQWDVVRNWIRFAVDLRALNPPAWATPKSPRLDVGEVVIDSINRKSMDWASPPNSPTKRAVVTAVAAAQHDAESDLRQLTRLVWREWALPNLSRHYLCDAARRADAAAPDKARGATADDGAFAGCDGNVDWDAVGHRHGGLRASLDGYRSPRMSVETRSSSSTGLSSETRTLREGQGRYILGDVDENLYEDEDEGGRWG